MRRSVLIALVVSVFMVAPAFAATIGPVKAPIEAGDMFLGVGYAHTESKWDDKGSFSSLETQQDQFYAQAGYGVSDNWSGYLRAGISTQDADNAFVVGDEFESFEGEDVVPFVSVGINGLFFENEILAVGPFVQGTFYLTENEDSIQSQALINNTLEMVEQKVLLDEMWQAKAGLQFQKELEGAQLYGGPMYYISRADIERRFAGLGSVSKTIEEENNFGFVVGIQWQLLENVNLDLEAQLRSAFDVGLVLNKRF